VCVPNRQRSLSQGGDLAELLFSVRKAKIHVCFWFGRLKNNGSSSVLVLVRMDNSEGFWFGFGPTARF